MTIMFPESETFAAEFDQVFPQGQPMRVAAIKNFYRMQKLLELGKQSEGAIESEIIAAFRDLSKRCPERGIEEWVDYHDPVWMLIKKLIEKS